MSNLQTCPSCGGKAHVDYLSVKVGKVNCRGCGYTQSMGELNVVSSNPDNSLGNLLGNLAVLAIGGMALAALFDALSDDSQPKKSRRKLREEDEVSLRW